ncbi:D-alanyl-D-alanine carboxypeptidase/D-alanyl-D-alanine-endopeptidase [Planktothrix sp. FACHB-1365]|uniref:D-alanyl-D-alanine carboxypeptidase/D-alanyl-D-alanine endopeptidase n=1 Tax=Planktothrix sp. FACHB-1365 TaxID=2692855 RepID=UPI001684825D|nr:D-alanyl-D-alanine carboxypeptidase/D-alanyl-D-alanine-endopeptidase [Planktothrix sp. FACHB-1365]MBD2483305.1 D-alanyl-D-alanine carboxypeptidase/D-alanyl-D-alanine-endopeptidase [Planktothrix sp. FACHB-1365]
MKKKLFGGLIYFLSLSQPVWGQTESASQKICPTELEPAINTLVNRPQFQQSRWGILIETLTPGTTLYNRDSQYYFIPASTVKLLTTAAAFQKLGANFKIRTSVYGDHQGNIYIVGRGDPSLTETQLKDLAQQLKNKGINQINQLIAVDGYFTGSPINSTWQWEDVQAGYGAPINSLILNQNSLDLILSPQGVGQPLKVNWVRPEQATAWTIENQTKTVNKNEPEFIEIGRDLTKPIIRVSGQLRVGAEPEPVYVAVVEPTENFIQEFKQVLINSGIQVLQTSIAVNFSYPSEELAWVESPPLSELIKTLNLESNNVFAESLLRTLGVQNSRSDSVESGLKEIQLMLTQLGVNPQGYHLVDGSGLSQNNLVTPLALVQTLRLMTGSPVTELYQNSLPVAGISGTLKGRFQDSSAVGIVQAKTGTLTGVSSLAGYISPPDYQPLVFSIMINQTHLPTSELRKAIDDIVLLLTRLKSCP